MKVNISLLVVLAAAVVQALPSSGDSGLAKRGNFKSDFESVEYVRFRFLASLLFVSILSQSLRIKYSIDHCTD